MCVTRDDRVLMRELISELKVETECLKQRRHFDVADVRHERVAEKGAWLMHISKEDDNPRRRRRTLAAFLKSSCLILIHSAM